MSKKKNKLREFVLRILTGFPIVVPLINFISGCSSNEVSNKLNFIVILADDLGYNDLGCFNTITEGVVTPNIDRLAANGIRFTDWQSTHSISGPSRASILTGRYPSRCGYPVSNNHNSPIHYENVGLNQDEVTIAEILKPLGYHTAALGKWHLGVHEQFRPLSQGFDEYYGCLRNFDVGIIPQDVYEGDSIIGQEIYENIHNKLTQRAIGIMKESIKEKTPFFIYLAHYLTHGPWEPGKQFTTDQEWAARMQYKGAMNQKVFPALVRELDWQIGLLLDEIKKLGLEENTVIFFLSDNGPWLTNNLERSAGCAWPLSGSKFNTFEGGHRVPAIVSCPGSFEKGIISDYTVSSNDIFPTIARLAGTELPVGRIIDGIDITPILKGGQIDYPENREILYYHATQLQAVRLGNWKLHLPRKPESVFFMGKRNVGRNTIDSLDIPMLFNLSNDIKEEYDVSLQYPEKVVELLNKAEERRKELGDWNVIGNDEHALTIPKDLIITRLK